MNMNVSNNSATVPHLSFIELEQERLAEKERL